MMTKMTYRQYKNWTKMQKIKAIRLKELEE